MLESQLLKDEKECAEHIMLVDLARNDVGKVCTLTHFASSMGCLKCVLHIFESFQPNVKPSRYAHVTTSFITNFAVIFHVGIRTWFCEC